MLYAFRSARVNSGDIPQRPERLWLVHSWLETIASLKELESKQSAAVYQLIEPDAPIASFSSSLSES
jgi:hypothetical protein